MKSSVACLSRGFIFLFASLALTLISPPTAHAGLTLDLQLQRLNFDGNYYFGCSAYMGTNTLAPQISPGTYRIESPLQPTNGFNNSYLLTTNGDFQGQGGGGSLYGDDNFPEFINNITNGLWSIYVTNTATTNKYQFRVTATLTSNSIPRVNITFPIDGATQVTDQPSFQWQGTNSWAGYIYAQASYWTNGDYEFQDNTALAGNVTNWTFPGILPPTTNQLFVQYVSNNTPALVFATSPTNGAGQVISGWSNSVTLVAYSFSEFVVGISTNSGGGGHTNLAHYNFENNSIFAQDVSGNGNNIASAGSFGGATGLTTNDTFAGDSYAMAYNGNGSGVGYFLAPPTNLLTTLAGSFSLSLWVKTTQTSGSDTDNGFNNVGIATAFQGANWILPMVLTGSKLAFVTGGSPNHLLRSSASINTGGYVHLVVTRNQATGEKKIYVDGVLDATGTGTTEALDSTTQFRLGASGGHGFNGRMDEVQLYSGVLDATEVDFLFNNPGSAVPDSSGGGGGTLADAVDTTGLVWITGGNANWTPQTSVTHDSIDAARSGALNIGNFDYSYIETTVTGPCTVSFWWRNIDNDNSFYTQFYIDGNNQNEIYGTTLWSQDGPYSIGPGTHTLQWASYDDGTLDSDAAGFLDQVVVTPLQLPTITLDPFSQTNRPAYQVALLTDATSPTNSPTFQWNKVGSGLIAGATNKLYIPTNSGAAGVAGNYFAVASNPAGSVTSATATVTFENVTAPPNWSTAFKSFLLGGNNGERRTNYGLCFLLDSSGTNLYSANSFTGTNQFASDTVISGPGKFSTVLMKQTTNGTSLWARGLTNTGNGNSFPQSIASAPGGGVYLSGIFRGTNGLGTNAVVETANGTTYLARFDNNGNVLWVRTLNGVSGTNNSYTYFHQLVADSAGSVTLSALISGTVTVGSTNLITSPTNQTGILAQFDANGNLRWAQILSGWPSYLAYSSGVIYGSMGGSPTNFIGGTTNTSDRQWTLFALNATNGQAIWLRNIASAQGQFTIGDIPAVTASGTNVFVTGTGVGSNATFGAISLSWPENLRQYFARYDTNGTAHIATTYGSPTVYPWATVADASGNVYVGGDFDTYGTFGSNTVAGYHKASSDANSPSHTFVAKFDKNGNALWTRTALASNYFVNCRDLALANDGIWTYGFVMHHANFGSFQVSGTTFIFASELQFLLGGAFGKITEAAAPVTPNPITLLSPTNNATQFQFSFNSQSGFTHSVLYRTNLAVGTWQTYSNVTGDGSLKIIAIPATTFGGSKHAFIRVSTQ